MMKRWTGGTWLAASAALLGLSLVSTVVSLIAGFNWDPNDYPESFYAAQIPKLWAVTGVSVAIPVLAAAASVMSILSKPRRSVRVATSVVALLVALSVAAFCGVFGMGAIQQATDYAEYIP